MSEDQPKDAAEWAQLLERARAREPMLRWFRFSHLPGTLQDMSLNFAVIAITLAVKLPQSAERTVALRKLLESKDAAVRAALPAEDRIAVKHETAPASDLASMPSNGIRYHHAPKEATP